MTNRGTRSVVACAVAVLTACDDQPLRCGPGAEERGDGVCVADVDECGDGTTLVMGLCLPEVTVRCGPGTRRLESACVPVDDLCDLGELWVDGRCIRPARCGDGTLARGDECVAVDAFEGVDIEEPPEPNHPLEDVDVSAPELSLPPLGDQLLVSGSHGTGGGTDLVGDLDGFAFDASGGDRLRIEATAVGAPNVAVGITSEDRSFRRWMAPVRTRNAAREVLLPADGRYLLEVTTGPEVEDLLAGFDATRPSVSDDFTYVVSIERVPPRVVEEVDRIDRAVDVTLVPEFRLGVASGTLVLGAFPSGLNDFESVPTSVSPRLWKQDEATEGGGFAEIDPGPSILTEDAPLVVADFELGREPLPRVPISYGEQNVIDLGALEPGRTVRSEAQLVEPGETRIFLYESAGSQRVLVDAEVTLGPERLSLSQRDEDFVPRQGLIQVTGDQTYVVVQSRSFASDVIGFRLNVVGEPVPELPLTVGDVVSVPSPTPESPEIFVRLAPGLPPRGWAAVTGDVYPSTVGSGIFSVLQGRAAEGRVYGFFVPPGPPLLGAFAFPVTGAAPAFVEITSVDDAAAFDGTVELRLTTPEATDEVEPNEDPDCQPVVASASETGFITGTAGAGDEDCFAVDVSGLTEFAQLVSQVVGLADGSLELQPQGEIFNDFPVPSPEASTAFINDQSVPVRLFVRGGDDATPYVLSYGERR